MIYTHNTYNYLMVIAQVNLCYPALQFCPHALADCNCPFNLGEDARVVI